jgi:HlyD family type I secretion membrane fusion protein
VAGLLFGIAFGAWAWFGRIQEVSHAQGRLEPKGAVYKIQPVTQGEIARILVKEGESVKAGQVIAVLDSRLAQAEVDRLRQGLAAYQLQHAQLRGLMEQTRQEMKTRQAIARADIQGQESAIDQVQSRIATARQTIAQLQAETVAYQGRLDRLQPLVAEGILAQEQLFEVEQAVREHERLVTQNQGEIEQYQAEDDRLRAGLSQKQAEGQQNELETQQRLQQLEREAADMAAKVAETQTLLKAAQTKLEQMNLYAPVNGVISSLNVHNAGEVIQPSQTIAEIGPDGAPLVLSAFLPNQEAGLVDEGMQVHVKFDAFPYQEYGVVSGRIISISPDAKHDEQLGAGYRVKVALEPNTKARHGIELKAGQTANAEIVTRQRRILDLLLDPIKKLQGGVSI